MSRGRTIREVTASSLHVKRQVSSILAPEYLLTKLKTLHARLPPYATYVRHSSSGSRFLFPQISSCPLSAKSSPGIP